MHRSSRTLLTAATAICLVSLGAIARAQTTQQARVISSTPITQWIQTGNGEEQRTTGYNVTYEFAGQRYTTRTAEPPGRSIAVQVGAQGVMTEAATTAESQTVDAAPQDAAPWRNVAPEPGVVLSGSAPGYPSPVYAPPVYARPAPLYAPAIYPAPVVVAPAYGYGYGSGYGYAAPYFAPPVGLSLNLGYSRGWGGGGYRGYGGYYGHRGYHGHHGWR